MMTSELPPMTTANPPLPDKTPTGGDQTFTAPPADPRALVAQMVAAGGWPEPELLGQIFAVGSDSIPLLLEILRNPPDGDFEVTPVYAAIGLLGMLHAREAVPTLVEIARSRWGEVVEEALEAVAAFGAIAVEPLLEAISPPNVRGYRRLSFISAAFLASQGDPALRARVSDFTLGLIREIVEDVRAGRELETELLADAERVLLADEPTDIHGDLIEEVEGFDDVEEDLAAGRAPIDDKDLDLLSPEDRERREELYNELTPDEELAHLAGSLRTYVGETALPLIHAAYDDDMIDTSFIRRDQMTAMRPEPSPPSLDGWLDDYTRFYESRQRNQALLTSQRMEPQIARPSTPPNEVVKAPVAEPEPRPRIEPVAPIRNTGPRAGRNDPCWCGSGKKYKKCHMGKDASQ